MNYFLKDVIEIYPLKNYVEFPEMSDYLTAEFITQLQKTNFYNEDKILKRIERKYQYNEIGTSSLIYRILGYFKFINGLVPILISAICSSLRLCKYLLVISTVSCPKILDKLYISSPFFN